MWNVIMADVGEVLFTVLQITMLNLHFHPITNLRFVVMPQVQAV